MNYRIDEHIDAWTWFQDIMVACAIFCAVALVFFETPVVDRKFFVAKEAVIEETTDSGWKYKARTDGSLEASFLDRTDPKIPTAVYEWNSSSMRMTMLTASGRSAAVESHSLSDGRLRLTGVLPGVYVEYHPIENGVKEDITIMNRDAAAASSGGISFSYALKFLGVQPAKNADGSFKPYIFNSGGKYAFHIAEPMMTDAEGRTSRDITATMRRTRSTDPWFDAAADPYSQWFLVIKPSQKWLLHEYRSYPVVVDPTVIRDESSAPD